MTQILYMAEHTSCNNYTQEITSIIETFDYPKGCTWGYPVASTDIFVVTGGELLISYDFFIEQKVAKGQMVLLAPGTQFKAYTQKGVSMVVLHLQNPMRLCDCFSLEELSATNEGLPLLEVKPMIQTFLSLFREALNKGLQCQNYLGLKIKEFFFLLRAYYTKEELALFFHPLLNKDLDFAGFILENYRKIKTVTEFATLYSCSVSYFDKKFRKAFGTSAYQWMKNRRMNMIYHEISTTKKSFRLIAKEQGFLSLPQFTDFCKKHLGEAPSKIRKNKRTNKKEGIEKRTFSG